MIFLVLSRSRKMIFLKKIHGNTKLSSNVLKRWSFEKRSHSGMTFVALFEKVVFFSRKRSIFPWVENMREMIFFKKYTEIYFLSDSFHAPLPKKFSYDLILQKHN